MEAVRDGLTKVNTQPGQPFGHEEPGHHEDKSGHEADAHDGEVFEQRAGQVAGHGRFRRISRQAFGAIQTMRPRK